jgi:MoxR-like ATPase
MDQAKQQWTTWLEGIPVEQWPVLADILGVKLSAGSNGKGHAQEEDQVTVTRTPTEDLYIKNPPPYVDIFGLHVLYRNLAFEQNLLLKGPKGDGKTLSVFDYAAQTKTPVVIQECSEDTKSFNLMGSQSMIGKKTIFTLGALPTAIEVANEVGRCILLLEELNALTPQVQKQLNALTDFRQMVSMPFIGKTYRLDANAKLWVVGTMNPCFHPDTDVLTPEGVRKIVDLKAGDKVYSFNRETGGQEIDTVANVWATPCDGELLVVENQHVKLRVTPQHKMVVKGRNASQWELTPAGELVEWMEDKGPTNADKLYPKPFELPAMRTIHRSLNLTELEGFEPSWLPTTNTKNTVKTEYETNDFMRLLGWYISEGSSYFTKKGEHRVHIAQEKLPGLEDLKALATRLEINYFQAKKGEQECGIVFNDKLLYNVLRHLGGVGAENKRIHHQLFVLGRSHLTCLFETLYLGDGDARTERENQKWALDRGTKVFRSMRYSTKSEQLYKDVLWLANYLNYTTSRHHDKDGMYRIGMRAGKPHTSHLEYEAVKYDGMVIDVEVSKNRTICAGEDGKFLYVSNSVYGGTYDLNEDLKSRFEELDLTYPEHSHEKNILKAVCGTVVDDNMFDLLIRFAKETRQQATGYALSTRDVVRLVKNVAKLGLDVALQMVVCKFEGEDRDTVMKRMASVFGPKNIKKYWGC